MILQGKIVEYIDHGKFFCGVVLEESGKRLRILNQNGREVSLPASRLMHQSRQGFSPAAPRDELLKEIKAIDGARRALVARVDLEGIWNLAKEESDSAFSPQFLAGLAFGEDADDEHVAAFLRCIFADRFFFKYKEGRIVVHSPEVVEQLQARSDREKEKEALLARGAHGLRQLFDTGVGPADWPEREASLRIVRDYYLFGNEAPEPALARELLKKAGLARPHDVRHLLVQAGVWRENENIPLLRSQLPVAFGDDVLRRAEMPEPDAETLLAEGRRDLRHLPLLTIDGAATRDFDDALHLEKQGETFIVGIHISDVAHYVQPGDLVFNEALQRITSIYFDDAQIPMLPRSLSEGACSLIAGKTRAAMSFLVRLSRMGDVLGYEIVPSVVTVQRQLNYGEAEAMIDKDEELHTLFLLSQRLRQKRIEAGALLLPIPDVNLNFNGAAEITVSLAEVDTPPRMLVAEFMVLANTLAADYVAERQVPGLFRAQEEPHQRLLEGYQEDLFSIWRQRKQLRPGQILTRPKPHSGVGVMQYTTVTSPIRRFLDLVMQHQIHNLLQAKGALFSDNELQDIIGAIVPVQSKVNQARREWHRYWLLQYLRPKVGRQVEALIVGKGPRRVKVVLTDCLLEGDLPPSQGVAGQPGDVVRVRIAKAEPLAGVLRLEW